MTPAGREAVPFGKNNAVIPLKTTCVHTILTPSSACGSSRASPSEREETSRGRRRRQLAGVRRHVQACNAGGPGAKKNISAALPPCRRWAGQPQGFPPDRWVSGQTGTFVVLGAGLEPTYTCPTARSSAAVCRAAAVALTGGAWAYPGTVDSLCGVWAALSPHGHPGRGPGGLERWWVHGWEGCPMCPEAPLASTHRWCTAQLLGFMPTIDSYDFFSPSPPSPS